METEPLATHLLISPNVTLAEHLYASAHATLVLADDADVPAVVADVRKIRWVGCLALSCKATDTFRAGVAQALGMTISARYTWRGEDWIRYQRLFNQQESKS